MDAKLVFGLVVIITISCGNAEKVKTVINVRQCNDSALKYVFVATLSGAHFPVDYAEGYTVFGPELKDKKTTLLYSGAQESYNLGKFLVNAYGEKLAGSKDKLDENFFRVYKSDYKRFEQTGQVISLGLQNKPLSIDTEKPADNYTTKDNTIKYIDGEEFVKFLDKGDCPAYYKKMETLKGSSDVENKINDYFDKVKNKKEKKPWDAYYNLTTGPTVEPIVPKEVDSKVLPLLKASTRKDAFKMMLLHETIQMRKRTGKRFEAQLGYWTDDDEENIAKLTSWLGLTAGSDNDVKSLTAGRILDEIFKQMDDVRKDKPINHHIKLKKDTKDVKSSITKDVKLVVLPAPPMVLAGLIGTFNGVKFNNYETAFYPRQGAMFVIELYESCKGDVWFYKAKYRSQGSNMLMEVTLPKVYDTNDVQTIFRRDVRNMLDNIRVDSTYLIGTLCKK